MKRMVMKLLVAALLVLAVASGTEGGPQEAGAWSAGLYPVVPAGGAHRAITQDVIGWFAAPDRGWLFGDGGMDAAEWELVMDGAVVPDAVHCPDTRLPGCGEDRKWETWGWAAQALENVLLPGRGDLVTCGWVRRGWTLVWECECHHKLCEALRGDFDALKNHEWERMVNWANTARSEIGSDLALARIHAGYAIHFAQDAIAPPHADDWASGGTGAPHTRFEQYDIKFWRKFGESVLEGLAANPQKPASTESIRAEIRDVLRPQTAAEWLDPPPGVAREQWDPACDLSAPPNYASCKISELGKFSCSAEEKCWYSPASSRNEAGVKNALQRAANLTQSLLVYIFDLKRTSGPPQPGQCTENVDVALIIDSSGSMSWNDPQDLRKEAARNFVTAMQNNDQAAVVDFSSDLEGSEDARLLFPLGQRTADPSAIYTAIERVGAYYNTNIRAGVQMGFEQLSASTQPNARAAVLLSDGEHNTGGDYTDADHQRFVDNGWPIYTVGLHVGGTAGEALLRDIAQDTGGQYFNLMDASQLVAAYNDVRSRVQCGQKQLENTLPVALGQTVEVATDVPSGQTSAAFLSNWAGSTVDMTLVDPNGRIIGPDTTDPDVAHIKGLVSELYRITDPVPGTWTIRLYGADVPPQGEEVTVVMTTVAPPDSTPPFSQLIQQRFQSGPMPIDLAFQAIDPPGHGGEEPSGVKHVELWYRYRGILNVPFLESLSPQQIRPQDMTLARPWSGWAQYSGTFATSPIPFTPPSGSGLYELYTLAVDNAGNREEPPATADARYLCIAHGERGWCVSVRWVPAVGLPEIIPGSPFGH
jgi:hypothetical protein